MKERVFILRTNTIRNHAVRFIGECALTDPPLEVIVRKHQDKRSRDQNALYWAWLHVIADETGNAAEDVHEAFKTMFLSAKVMRLGNTYVGTINPSTARLPIGAFGEYMDRIAAWAAQNGIRLPVNL